MTKYEKGKIYKIISDNTDKIYIGSSCEPTLAHRLSKHRSNYKAWLKDNTNQYITSYEILKLENYSIILIENYPCNNKDELQARERHYIELNKNIIVNKVIPLRKPKEYRQDYKEYYQEYSKKYNKEYHQNNKDKIKEQQQQYRDDNKDKIKERSVKYYDNNKDKILNKLKNQELIKCGCGAEIQKSNNKHVDSKKHKKLFEKNNNTDNNN